MTAMPVVPHEFREWTVDDLERIPDDGLQYELLDGMLLVSPSPAARHQWVSGRLFLILTAGCPAGLKVFFAPLDWQPDPLTSFQPDLLVVRDEDVDIKNITRPLVLAVEVLSLSTRRKDLLLKRSKYEDSGVANYWIVDPEATVDHRARARRRPLRDRRRGDRRGTNSCSRSLSRSPLSRPN